jgi:hypothetical protein
LSFEATLLAQTTKLEFASYLLLEPIDQLSMLQDTFLAVHGGKFEVL